MISILRYHDSVNVTLVETVLDIGMHLHVCVQVYGCES